MKRILDELFCQYAVAKNFVPEDAIALQNQSNIITVREYLLLTGYVSLEAYGFILSQLPKEEFDEAERSKKFDDQFLEYGIAKKIFSQKAPENYKKIKDGLPIITKREALLLANVISFEAYRAITLALLSPRSPKEQDISAETVIDQSFEEEKIAHSTTIIDRKLTQTSDISQHTTIIDGKSDMPDIDRTPPMGIEEMTRMEEITTLFQSEQEIMHDSKHGRDESVETLVDTNPIEHSSQKKCADLPSLRAKGLYEEPVQETPSLEHIELGIDTTIGQNTSTYPASKSHIDGSAETLVDQPMQDNPVSPLALDNEQAINSDDQPQLLGVYVWSQQPTATINSDDQPQLPVDNLEPTIEINSPGKILPGIEDISESIEKQDALDEIQMSDTPISSPQVSHLLKQSDLAESEILLSTPIVKTLIQEVTREVNLQTQQINQAIGQRLNSYRVLVGIAVFVAVFMLIFTGVIEWQRLSELNQIRHERNQAIQNRDNAVQEKEMAIQNRLMSIEKLYQQNSDLQTSLKAYDNQKAQMQQVAEEMQRDVQNLQAQKVELMGKMIEAETVVLQQQLQAVSQTYRFHFSMALLYYRDQKYGEALKSIHEALETTTTDKNEQSTLYAWRALVYQQLKKSSEAQADIKTVMNLDRQNVEALLAIATYWQNENKFQDAIKVLEKVPAKSKGIWRVHMARAILYFLLKDTPNSNSEWNKALQMNPGLKNIYY